ncbi:MAG: MFS transporter [Bacteroidales bacterium]|jgi:POT family proton-dependent oligopeptide transporter|nr:MFS transporter [Bacteroidales bacterium]NLK79916.1 MFS transporter [Bacteroidales bacterium]
MKKPESGIRSFPKNYWTAISMEFFERGAYYGVLSILSVYLVLSPGQGGLGFSREAAGAIMGTIPPLLYFIPLFAGALADRYGFRNLLMIAFSCLTLGYFLTGCMTSYGLVFASLVVMAVGAGLFKPVISGTIAHSTTEKNSTLGFGIFYWAINLGAFLFPLLLVPTLKKYSYSYVFWMAAAAGVILLLMNIFLYKEPVRKREDGSFAKIIKDLVSVFKDRRFILMILIYSGFWIMYFQMYGTVLWYVSEHMNMAPVNKAVNSFLSLFTNKPVTWAFDVEHVTVLNAGVIIVLQLFVSKIVNKFKAVPTIIAGIALGTLGMAILAISGNAWVFITGCVVFTLGEMTAHPKFNSFVGLIAPADKKGLYMGYSFFCSVIGSFVGGFIGAPLYNHFVDNMGRPDYLWLLFSCIGFTSVIGLVLFNRHVVKSKSI